MPVPTVPGTNFVLIQSHFSFPFLKTLLHRPARAESLHHLLQRGASGGKDQHIGHLCRFGSLVQASAHQQPVLPPIGLRCCEFDARPCEEARSFAPHACTQFLPILSGYATCYLIHSPAGSLHLYMLFAGYRQCIRLLAGLQTCPQRLCASVHGITSHPSNRETSIQSAPEHAGSQFRLGGKGHRSRHMGFLATLLVVGPTLGQIQFSVQQRVSTRARIGKKHAYLTVFDASSRATVLPLNTSGFAPLFEKSCLIDDQHCVGICKRPRDVCTQLISRAVAIPLGSIQQVLHSIRGGFPHLFCHLPPVFSFY